MGRYAFLTVALTLTLVAGACAPMISAMVSNDLTQSLSVGAKPALSVELDSGSVTVTRGPSGRIDIAATRRAAGQAALNALFLDIGRDGDRVRIVFRRSADALANQSVTLRITVPENTAISIALGAGSVSISDTSEGATVRTGAGSITMRDVRGALEAVTGAGDIEIWAADGQVRAESSAGSVKAEGLFSGSCRLATAAGGVTVRLYPNAGLRVSARGLSVRDEMGIKVSADGREATGVVGDGSRGTLEALAVAGRVELLKR